MTKYKIEVNTANIADAGTDANISIILLYTGGRDWDIIRAIASVSPDHGAKVLEGVRRSPEFNLNSPADDFERGKSNTFEVECSDVGELDAIYLRNDMTGSGAGWNVSTVFVTNMSTGVVWWFRAFRWLSQINQYGQSTTTVFGVRYTGFT